MAFNSTVFSGCSLFTELTLRDSEDEYIASSHLEFMCPVTISAAHEISLRGSGGKKPKGAHGGGRVRVSECSLWDFTRCNTQQDAEEEEVQVLINWVRWKVGVS